MFGIERFREKKKIKRQILRHEFVNGNSLRWRLFFGWIEKAKYFDFFYSAKSTLLILTNIIKVNLLSISLV